MRSLLTAVLCVVFFGLGIGAQRHLSSDELQAFRNELDLLEAHVEVLVLRCHALEREASELRVRKQGLVSDGL
jgi:hypothetical protein